VDVRSSIPGGYASFSGTSMAAPHVSGTVALMWSAVPALVGDIATTRQILDATALSVNDTSCGGTADDHNVWGEGRLEALGAVQAASPSPAATVRGTVTDAATGQPLAGASVAAAGRVNRTAISAADGTWQFVVPSGTYTVTTSKFAYVTNTATVALPAGQ